MSRLYGKAPHHERSDARTSSDAAWPLRTATGETFAERQARERSAAA